MEDQALSSLTAADIYLKRYAYSKRYLQYVPPRDTQLVVVIPCFNETNLIASLNSIKACEAPCSVEVIVVINASEQASKEIHIQNQLTYNSAVQWLDDIDTKHINFHFILENNLPKKHAGVGLARKIGMDEAVRMFDSIENPNGIILCYDADCTCESNLLQEVYRYFQLNSKSPGCSIFFEHPLEGALADDIYLAITSYELHLRYYVNALKFAGFPYAHQTIGSSMAVRVSAYCKQGGMNRRKAGEDFYFLHKIIPLGGFGEVNSTKVYPSPRVSDRVPFGTGRAVGEWLEGRESRETTYNPTIFKKLQALLNRIDSYYELDDKKILDELKLLPESVKVFLKSVDFEHNINEIKNQSTSIDTFRKRFFGWFDGFLVLKYVHCARDGFYANVPIGEAIDWFLDINEIDKSTDLEGKLINLRSFDRLGH